MSAEFKIRIDKISTTSNDQLQDMIKEVSWTMQGKQDNCSFELPQITVLPDSDEEGFISISDITEEDVIGWVTEHTNNIDAIKGHIQSVLDKECASKELVEKPFPWISTPPPPQDLIIPADATPNIIISIPLLADIPMPGLPLV